MSQDGYFDYLRRRSFAALAYRRLYLYPRLRRHLRGRVLDVGCGIGDLLSYLGNAVGVDVNPQAVAWCRSRGLDVRQYAGERLPFPDGEFGSTVLDNVLEHIADPRALLSEIHRVTRSGGVLVVGVPGERGYASDPDHKVYYDEAELRTTVEAAGFAATRFLRTPVPLASMSRLLRQYCIYGIFSRAA